MVLANKSASTFKWLERSDRGRRLRVVIVELMDKVFEFRRRRDLPDCLRRDVGLPPRPKSRRWHDYL